MSYIHVYILDLRTDHLMHAYVCCTDVYEEKQESFKREAGMSCCFLISTIIWRVILCSSLHYNKLSVLNFVLSSAEGFEKIINARKQGESLSLAPDKTDDDFDMFADDGDTSGDATTTGTGSADIQPSDSTLIS